MNYKKQGMHRFSALFASAFLLSALVPFGGVGAQSTAGIIGSQLSVGAQGSAVSALQAFLSTESLTYPPAITSGYFGALTQKAVTNFQIGYNIPATGTVGPLTLAAMNSLIASGKRIDTSAPVISGFQENVSGRGVTLFWNTNELARAKVHFGTDPLVAVEVPRAKTEPFVTGSTTADDVLSFSKRIAIDNLSPRTTYYYMVKAIDDDGNVSVLLTDTFTTGY